MELKEGFDCIGYVVYDESGFLKFFKFKCRYVC